MDGYSAIKRRPVRGAPDEYSGRYTLVYTALLYPDDFWITKPYKFLTCYESILVPDPVELANDINSDLVNVMNWLNVIKLQSHSSKTKFMTIGSKQKLNNKVGILNSSITMNNKLISSVASNKCLGVDIDETLSFHTHIEEICKKICSGIGILRRIKPFVPQGSLVTLYKSLIQPYLDYCAPLWDTCGKTLREKLQILQNRAAYYRSYI